MILSHVYAPKYISSLKIYRENIPEMYQHVITLYNCVDGIADFICVSTSVFHVLLYGLETWSVTLREKHRIRVIENGALREVLRRKREEINGK